MANFEITLLRVRKMNRSIFRLLHSMFHIYSRCLLLLYTVLTHVVDRLGDNKDPVSVLIICNFIINMFYKISEAVFLYKM